MAHVYQADHAVLPAVQLQTIHAFPPQPQGVTTLWLVLIAPIHKGWPGWVALGGWSHTEINVPHRELNPDTVTHLCTNRARHWLTSLVEANVLTTTPGHHQYTSKPFKVTLHDSGSVEVLNYESNDLTNYTTIQPHYSHTVTMHWIKQGLTSHQTHYRSYRRRVFMGHMTQPTVSKHWKKIGPKDNVSIPSGPPHRAHNNTTTHMQYETKTHKIHTDKHK